MGRVDRQQGTVFVSTYGYGHVYRLPWQGKLEDLGRPDPRTSFTWEGDTDDHGNFYFGTSDFFGPAPLPGGRLFGWNAATRKYRDYGDWGAKYGYVRSVEYAGGKLYVGLGPTAGLWQVDPKTGKRKEIPFRPACRPTSTATSSKTRPGTSTCCSPGGTTGNDSWVLDLKTLKWAHHIPGYGGQTISDADSHGRVWLVDSGELKLYDPSTAP